MPTPPESPLRTCLDENQALDFVEGVCTPQAARDIEGHVDGCSPCRQLLSALARDASGDERTVRLEGGFPAAEQRGEAPSLQRPWTRGRGVGRYLVLDPLGEGGMGVVYSAYDPELDRKVALKFLRADNSQRHEGQARLLREAQAMARLQHPNVLAVFDVGTLDEDVFIAMEFVRGHTLKAWMGERRRAWREVLEVFLAAGRGLAAAHAAGLVHRDFKPDNVLMSGEGRVQVTDFGLARDLGVCEPPAEPDLADSVETRRVQALTRTGAIMGTPAYMAPEQFLGGEVDARTDQFSFCVALYEALHGQKPFAARSTRQQREQVLRGEVRSARRADGVPSWVRRLLLRGLRVRPEERFESMGALLARLERGPLAVRRRRLGAVALGTLALVGAGFFLDLHQRRERCQGVARRLEGIWDEARRQQLEGVFLGTHQPYAPDAWSSVARTLEGYTARWKGEWTRACEATWVEQRQSEALLHRRERCLDWRREKVRALTDLLAQATEREVRESVKLVGALPGLEACGAEEVQQSRTFADAQPLGSAESEALRTRLARIETLYAANHYREARDEAQAVQERAHVLQERSLEAESLYLRGMAHEKLHEDAEAERLLTQAALGAEALGQDELKVRAQTGLVWLFGLNLGQFERAHAWGRQTQASLDRLGRPPILQYPLDNSLAGTLFMQSRFTESLGYVERARGEAGQALGADHPWLAGMESNYGVELSTMGRYAESTTVLQHALDAQERWLGARHPEVASTRLSLVYALLEQKRLDEASSHAQRSMDVLLQYPGDGDADLLRAWMYLGQISLARGQPERALESIHKAQALDRHEQGVDSPTEADILGVLGEALGDLGRHTEASSTLERAIALWSASLGPANLVLAEPLLLLGKSQLALGHPEQALASFERGLGLQDFEQNELKVNADTRFALAQVLVTREGQQARARALAQRAREFYSRFAWHSAARDTVDAWLARHAGVPN